MNYLRKTYLEINEDAIRFNIHYLEEKSGKKLIGIIKANGYGTNDVYLANLLIGEGVKMLAVSSIDEAIYLRKCGIECEMLILGEVDIDQFDYVRKYGFSIVTVSKDYVLNNIENFKGVKVHLKLNTGMNRIGILPNETHEVFDALNENGAVVTGIMTHYACSDSDDEFTLKQYKKFEEVVKSFDYDFEYIHSCNTDATVAFKDSVSNCVRCGNGTLGYSEKESELKESLALYTEVVNTKSVPEGEGVSYGQHYISDGKGYILTLPVGYADGFLRKNTGKEVYVGDEYGVIVGSVCMDQLMVHTENYHAPGEKVELFGEHISLKKRSEELETINYEIITGISDRVTRIFVKDGKEVKEINNRFR